MDFFEHMQPLSAAGLGVLAAGAAVSFASGRLARVFNLKSRTGLQLSGLAAAAAGCLMVVLG